MKKGIKQVIEKLMALDDKFEVLNFNMNYKCGCPNVTMQLELVPYD